jgi:hypothetical protein
MYGMPSFSQNDFGNMLGTMLGHSMRVSGVGDPDGDSVRKVLAPQMLTPQQKLEADQRAKSEYQAKHLAGLSSPANQAWLASLKPEDRQIYELMQRTF